MEQTRGPASLPPFRPKPHPPKDLELPPINLKSPDGQRVLEVRDPEKAESMAKKGWKITDDKKTPYVPQPHLTNRPLAGDPSLQEMLKSMSHNAPKDKKQPTTRKGFRKNKEKK